MEMQRVYHDLHHFIPELRGAVRKLCPEETVPGFLFTKSILQILVDIKPLLWIKVFRNFIYSD